MSGSSVRKSGRSVRRVVHSETGHVLEEDPGVDETHGAAGAVGGAAHDLGQEALAGGSRFHQEDALAPVRQLQGASADQQAAPLRD